MRTYFILMEKMTTKTSGIHNESLDSKQNISDTYAERSLCRCY